MDGPNGGHERPRGRRVEQDLVRRELRAGQPGDREEPARTVDEADRLVRGEGSHARRHADRLAATDRDDRRVGNRDRRQVEPGVDRPEERLDRRRTVGGGRPQGVDLRRVGELERPARGPHQRAEVRAALPTASPRSRASDRTYVPAEHSTSTIATGSPGVVSSQSTSSSAWIVTARGASSTVSPARASAYARRPATLIAL